jgi:hypothetical protein
MVDFDRARQKLPALKFQKFLNLPAPTLSGPRFGNTNNVSIFLRLSLIPLLISVAVLPPPLAMIGMNLHHNK